MADKVMPAEPVEVVNGELEVALTKFLVHDTVKEKNMLFETQNQM